MQRLFEGEALAAVGRAAAERAWADGLTVRKPDGAVARIARGEEGSGELHGAGEDRLGLPGRPRELRAREHLRPGDERDRDDRPVR